MNNQFPQANLLRNLQIKKPGLAQPSKKQLISANIVTFTLKSSIFGIKQVKAVGLTAPSGGYNYFRYFFLVLLFF